MKKLLQELYGSYYVQTQQHYDAPELSALWEQREALERELEQALPAEKRPLLRQYLALSAKVQYLHSGAEFADGASFGGRLVLELLLER